MPDKTIAIILIDDELSARNMIKNLVRDNQIYHIIADFSECRIALEWLKENKADIAICDMNMPQVDGIEFITMAKSLSPELHFIAISGYSDFYYLRECMINSVEDYLLKHTLSAELLLNTLNTIRTKYNILPEKHEQLMVGHRIEAENDFNSDYIHKLIDNGSLNFTPESVLPVLLSPDYDHDQHLNYELFKTKILFVVSDIINQILSNKYQYIVHLNLYGQFAILFSMLGSKAAAEAANTVRSLCLKIKDRLNRMLNLTITIAIGNACCDLDTALKQCVYIKNIRDLKFYLDAGSIVSLDKVRNIQTGSYNLPSYFSEQLKVVTELGDYKSIKELVAGIFSDLVRVRCNKDMVVKVFEQIVDIFNNELSNNGNMPDSLLKIDSIRDYEFITQFEKRMYKFIENYINAMNAKPHTNYSITISRVAALIDRNYQNDISLDECAEQVGISYTHLSHIFKKETGFHFSEYLNKIRVGKAKILLAEKKYSIKEIADITGFRNYNYFFKVFKDTEGITPNEYIEFANKVIKIDKIDK